MKTSNLLPNIVDLLLDAVFMVDVHGRIVYVSAACERIFGYTPAELTGRTMIDLIVPEDRGRTSEEARHVMAGLPRIGFENRYIRKDGSHVHIMWSACWSESEQLRIGVARDVTEKKRSDNVQAATYAISEASQNTTDLLALFRELHPIIVTLVPAAGFAVAITDPKTRQLNFPYQAGLYGNGNASAMQESVARLLCAEVNQSRTSLLLSDEMAAALAARAGIRTESGSWLAVPLLTRQASVGALVVKSHRHIAYGEKDKESLQFISGQIATAIERRTLHAELMRAARYDELTGLPNRRFFYEKITASLGRERSGRYAALLYIDINGFKQINDAFGHTTGDGVLQEFARRLKSCVREADMVARLGGDEFVIFIDFIPAADNAMAVSEKIQAAFERPMQIDGQVLKVGPSIGIAIYPDHGTEPGQLLKHADHGMYLDKKKAESHTNGTTGQKMRASSTR